MNIDGRDTNGTVYADHFLMGAGQGGSAHGVVLDAAGNLVRDCGTGELVTLRGTDQVVEIQLAGGAGYGDPRTRPAASVERDLAEGIIPAEAADRCCGVTVTAGKAAE